MAQGEVLPEILAQQGAHAEARGDSPRTGGGGGGDGGGGGAGGGRGAGADAARFSEECRAVTMRSRVLEQARTVAVLTVAVRTVAVLTVALPTHLPTYLLTHSLTHPPTQVLAP